MYIIKRVTATANRENRIRMKTWGDGKRLEKRKKERDLRLCFVG
jgi:hypothetical protein